IITASAHTNYLTEFLKSRLSDELVSLNRGCAFYRMQASESIIFLIFFPILPEKREKNLRET
ncbi:hypothetical protein, partial [Oceanospirillum sediminis]|uniref:hypothetical protein n=1 Tax=Oceanospirillum sediminis TaxID=2760088 RepID=UPI001C71BA19